MAEFLVFQKHLFPSVEPFAYAVPKRDSGNGVGTRTHHHFFHIDVDFGLGPTLASETHDKQHLGLCSFDDFADLLGSIPDIDHARDGANLVQRIKTSDGFGHGGQRDGNDVALTDAMTPKSGGNFVDAVKQSFVCQVDAKVCDGNFFRYFCRGFFQDFVKAIRGGFAHSGSMVRIWTAKIL